MNLKWKMLILCLLAVFVRFFALETSTHFLSDESRDLVNIHQIWVEKKLTLVGPISDDRSHVFSSLTYYMLLPFAVMWHFDPLGTVVGAAVWGVTIWGIIVWVIYKFNRRLTLWGAGLTAIWFPLVQTSRWPWNPNLMLFWLFLGLNLPGFWAGLAFGLAVHHHYLALIPGILMCIKKRDWRIAIGIGVALLPFVIFDLRHPPGIFITRMIEYNQGVAAQKISTLIFKIPQVFKYFADYVFQQKAVAWVGIISIIFLAGWDLVKKSPARGWWIMWTITLFPLIFYSAQFHYLLPALPFFVMWLVTERTKVGNKLAKLIILLLIIGSGINLPIHFEQPDWQGNLIVLRGGAAIIGRQITSQNLKNPNLAVLSSPDIYPAGKKFRDLLLVSNIRVKPYEEYETSDNLFVVTKADEITLRQDPAAEMMYFRNGPVAGVWEVSGTKWKVIQFNRY